MREHDHLQAVVGHVAGEILVNLHHRAAKVFAIATHRQLSASIGSPFGESVGELLVVPSEKIIAQFVIIHRICIGRVGDPKIADFTKITSIRGYHLAVGGNVTMENQIGNQEIR